jgi:hypothetical protein
MRFELGVLRKAQNSGSHCRETAMAHLRGSVGCRVSKRGVSRFAENAMLHAEVFAPEIFAYTFFQFGMWYMRRDVRNLGR